MFARSTIKAAALVLGLAIGAALYVCGAYTLATPTHAAATIGTAVTVERAPSGTLLADGADSPDADAEWAALVAEHGTLDYVGGYSYGTVYAVDGGYAVGFAAAEDSDIWSDPSCLTTTAAFRGDH